MKLSNTRKKILKKNFRSIDLRNFVGCLFADKIPREHSASYDQLANVEECIYPAAQRPILSQIRHSNDWRQR